METQSNEITTPKTHSGFGIASFVIAIVSIVFVLGIFGYAGYVEVSTPGGIDEDTPQAVLIGLLTIVFAIAIVVGIALGFAGLIQASRKRVFSIIGLIINLLTMTLIALVLYLGSTA